MHRPIVSAALVFTLTACAAGRPRDEAALPAGLAAPGCAGRDLDLDALGDACRFDGSPAGAPDPGRVSMSLEPAAVTVASGGKARVTARFENRGERPLVLEFFDGCLAFDVQILDEKGARADRIEACTLGGLCGHGRPQRVEIAPGGVLRRSVEVVATRVVVDASCASREEKLPPGRYVLRVRSPFEDRDPRDPTKVVPRQIEGALVVTD